MGAVQVPGASGNRIQSQYPFCQFRVHPRMRLENLSCPLSKWIQAFMYILNLRIIMVVSHFTHDHQMVHKVFSTTSHCTQKTLKVIRQIPPGISMRILSWGQGRETSSWKMCNVSQTVLIKISWSSRIRSWIYLNLYLSVKMSHQEHDSSFISKWLVQNMYYQLVHLH